MKTAFAMGALLAALTIAAAAHGNEKLLQSSGCMTCHALDKKLIGPSYKEVAAKYQKDKNAEGYLLKKVKAGGKGVWGDIPMPPNAHVKDQDAQTMVRWILSLK